MNRDEWGDLVVICGGQQWEGIGSTSQELAKRLAAQRPVLYVDPPVSLVSRWRDGRVEPAGRVHEIADRLARLTPVVQPGIERPVLARLTDPLLRRSIRKAVRRLEADVEVVMVEGHHDVFGACGERRKVVYATDDYVAGAELMGVQRDVLIRRRARQARGADLAVCITDELARTWHGLGVETVVVPNGCDPDAYAAVDSTAPAPDVVLEPPIAGFIGHISERIDLALLDAVRSTGLSLLIVGPRPATPGAQSFDALLAHENVQWVPERPRSDMPSYLRWIDVGLTPYADTPFNRASFPLKTLDYLAAGRPVVATGLPATRWLATDLVTIADDPAGFARAAVDEANSPRTSAMVERRQAFARQHSWDQRCADLIRHLELT